MRPLLFPLVLCCLLPGVAGAQQRRPFTLEEVIPGGRTYADMVQPDLPGLKWWGAQCIRTEDAGVWRVDTDGRERLLTDSAAVHGMLADGGLAGADGVSLAGARMPWPDRPVLLLGHGGRTVAVDVKRGRVVSASPVLPQGAGGTDYSVAGGCTAFCREGGLYVALPCVTDGVPQADSICRIGVPAPGVVYGQAVHRNEFGIQKGTFWSPDGERLAFYRMDQEGVACYPQVDTRPRMAQWCPDVYPMAGEASHSVTVGVWCRRTGETVYLDTPRTDGYLTCVCWSPDGREVLLTELNRGQDSARLVRYDARTGQCIGTVYEERHSRYVEPQETPLFLPWDGRRLLYWSRRDGFAHLYVIDLSRPVQGVWRTGADSECSFREHYAMRPLTQGAWNVKGVLGFDVRRRRMVIASTEVSPLQTDLFCIDVESGRRRGIGRTDGTHAAQLSSDGRWLIDRFVSASVPRRVSLLPVDGGRERVLFCADDPLAERYDLPEITVGTIKAADGVTDLYYRMVRPVGFDPKRKYPAIVYVYGGPHAQLIRNTRFYDARGWDLYMAQLGYVVFTVDGRGSDNRGVCFENRTFGRLGQVEMEDQVQGARFLQGLPYVDAGRIGVHGWSFGGFMTINLMLTYPDIFKVGVAGGPVTDWRLYEVMYGERYMNRPQENPEGYELADLKRKAGNLKGRLLIIHGGMDPVCVPQHSFTFLRACIDAGSHPDFFVYPEAGHNMTGRDRVHLHHHITRYFADFLK